VTWLWISQDIKCITLQTFTRLRIMQLTSVELTSVEQNCRSCSDASFSAECPECSCGDCNGAANDCVTGDGPSRQQRHQRDAGEGCCGSGNHLQLLQSRMCVCINERLLRCCCSSMQGKRTTSFRIVW
jgi:hypothetical protein